MKKFTQKIVLITGAAGDLGKHLTKSFLDEGAKVVAVDNNLTQLSILKEECQSDSLIISQADVTESADMKSIVEIAEEEFGGLDVAIFNAGIVGSISPIETYPEETFDKVMAVNVKGVWLGIKHAGPAMRRRGGGSIVIMSSIAGLIGDPNTSAYIASKHAVIGICRGAAKELGKDQIRVNCVNPGQLDVGMVREFDDDQRNEIINDVPLGRLGTAEDVSRLTMFLASNDSRYITGTVNVIDGGYCGY